MKHIKHGFYQRPGSDPLGGLRGWDQKVKIQLFQNMVMLHIKLKGLSMQRRRGKHFARSPSPLTLGTGK